MVTKEETNSAELCIRSLFRYNFCKECHCKSNEGNDNDFLPSMKLFLSRSHCHETEESKYVYLGLVDENADSKVTMENMLSRIYNSMGVGKHLEHVLVVGDGKTYDYLIKLKQEHPEGLKWLLPFPGDWHMLKNFGSVLMKIYSEAGLKELVQKFHRGSTATSVLTGGNFEKTFQFLTQCWEAFYRYEINLFFSHTNISGTERLSTETIIKDVADIMGINNWQRAAQKGKICGGVPARYGQSRCIVRWSS